MVQKAAPKVVELFAGVGGFRLALDRSGWHTAWANQWEPATKAQHAFDCYVRHFLPGAEKDALNEVRTRDSVAVNEDIARVLDEIEAGDRPAIPDHDLLVGGFPCQDYSVAKTLNQAHGIEGKKGVLWWSIYRILEDKRPRFIFLENVDRLLKSPADQRGRDFAIILACLADLGYRVEWRVANAADYGFPQRRRRVFIIGELTDTAPRGGALRWITRDGVLARALPVLEDADEGIIPIADFETSNFELKGHPAQITQEFGWGNRVSPFLNSGVMWHRQVWTRSVRPVPVASRATLGGVLLPTSEVPDEFFVPEVKVASWTYLKGPKREKRTAANGHEYWYSEGGIAFPDALDLPSRTILTGEGGTAPSRFKHIVQTGDGRLRRLAPVELERLNGFPDDWTAGMPDGKRAFMMGNALVVGLVEKVGIELGRRAAARKRDQRGA